MLTDEERKEHRRAGWHRWFDLHRNSVGYHEKRRLVVAKWRKINQEKVVKERKLYYEVNRQKAIADALAWQREYPEANRLKCCKRRALKYANTPPEEMLIYEEWMTILAEAAGHCSYCGREDKLTLDHIVPLSRGGKHSKDNVVPACSHCNFSKGTKTVEEWNKVTRQQLEAARG